MGMEVVNVGRNNSSKQAVSVDFIIDGVLELSFIKTKSGITEAGRTRLDKNRIDKSDLKITKNLYLKAKNTARAILGKCQCPIKKSQHIQLNLF